MRVQKGESAKMCWVESVTSGRMYTAQLARVQQVWLQTPLVFREEVAHQFGLSGLTDTSHQDASRQLGYGVYTRLN